jgi:ribosome-binding ATPase YchF (GTP1/OBG family)
MAEALIHVVDASGCTDSEGKLCQPGTHNPVNDIDFLQNEISYWISDIISKGWQRMAKQTELECKKVEEVLHSRLTGLGVSLPMVSQAIRQSSIPSKPTQWTDEDLLNLSKSIQKISKPMIIAANKADIAPDENIHALSSLDSLVVPTSAEMELALRRATQAGLIEYQPGASEFKILAPEKLNDKQNKALEKIALYLKKTGSTGVEKCIETAAFKLLDLIVVYPVEDETHLTDKEGRVLPDAFLMRRGSTALDLAFKVHTDIGKNFIRAINARTKRVVGSEYILQDSDVIKIVAKV